MKFREIVLESGTRLFLGKNAENNDELMNKFVGEKDIIMHTVASGSPFCVIDGDAEKKDVKEAAVACAAYSQDWRDNKKDVKVNIFTGKDVNKKKGMKVGTWKVKKSKTKIVKKKDIIKFKK